jgi:hypothetical protein
MMDRHEAEVGELQARAEAIQRQLVLVRSINPDQVSDDIRELEDWLTERLDQLEMEICTLEFGDCPR